MINKKWIIVSPFFVHFKEHFCPICNEKIQVKRTKKIVNSKSEEAKNFDFSFSGDGGFMSGDVEFIFEVFYCSSCKKEFSIKEIRNFERKRK